MSNVTQMHTEHHNPVVAHAANEVRGIMAAKRIPGYKLPEATRTETSRGYWQRRLTGDVAFDLDDLSNLAAAFDMTLPALLARITADLPTGPRPLTQKTPTANGEGVSLPRLDSNQQPAGIQLAPVTSIATTSDAPETGAVAPVTRLFA